MKNYVKTFEAFTEEERKKLSKKSYALPDGSFPIENEKDLKAAIHAYGRSKDKPHAKKHIIKRAKALGKKELIPETWLKESADMKLEGFHEYNYDYICDTLSNELGEDPGKIYHFCSLFEEFSDGFVVDMPEEEYTVALKKYIEDVNAGVEPDPREDESYYDTIDESNRLNEDRYTDLSERERQFKREFKELFNKLKSRDFDEEHCLKLVKDILK